MILAAVVWQVSRNWLYRAAALVPLAVELSLGLLFRHYKDLVPAPAGRGGCRPGAWARCMCQLQPA